MTKARNLVETSQTLSFENTQAQELLLRIEPWGDEHRIAPGERFRVIAKSEHEAGELHIESAGSTLTIYGWEGSTIEVEMRGSVIAEYGTPVPATPAPAADQKLVTMLRASGWKDVIEFKDQLSSKKSPAVMPLWMRTVVPNKTGSIARLFKDVDEAITDSTDRWACTLNFIRRTSDSPSIEVVLLVGQVNQDVVAENFGIFRSKPSVPPLPGKRKRGR